MRIIVGVDGGPQEPSALALAAQLSRVEHGRITLVHAYGRRDGEAGQGILNGASRWLAGASPRTRLVPGRAAVTLQALAVDERADVIVIGSCHRGPIGRTALGGTGDRVVHGAPCPVAVAPRDFEPDGMRRVAVAFDGGPESREALAWAERLARRLDGEVTRVTVQAGTGPVAPQLLEAARGADILVAGSRGHGPVGQIVLGSVSRRLMHDCPVPLTVVPRSALPGRAPRIAPVAG